MVAIMNENQAKNLFVSCPDVVAFTWDGTKRPSKDLIDYGVELTYADAGFLPSSDVINGIINGDITLKSVIKNIKKSIFNYKNMTNDDMSIAISFSIILRMYESTKRPILVFVEPEAHDKIETETNKIMRKIITSVFAELDMLVINGDYSSKKNRKLALKYKKKLYKALDKDVVKRVSDGSSSGFKVKKKAAKKVAKNVRELENSCKYLTITRKGIALNTRLNTVFSIEIKNAGIAQFDLSVIRAKKREALVWNLLRVLTGANLLDVNKMDVSDSKSQKKLAKSISAIDKAHARTYQDLREIMDGLGVELPKAEVTRKRNKKRDKKFYKFFNKRKNLTYLVLAYSHLSAIHFGVDPTKGEYKKLINDVLSGFDRDFVDSYLKAVKEFYSNSIR